MITALFLSLGFFAQTADSLENHKHVSGISSVQSVQTLNIRSNNFADSSRNFYNFTDLNDVVSFAHPGLRYKTYGFGVPTATVINGLLPNYQSVVINGYEWNDPVTGSLHPTVVMLSSLYSLDFSRQNSSEPNSMNLTTGTSVQSEPKTVINYLDGYEKLSLFEGLFSVQVNPTFSVQVGMGKKSLSPQDKSSVNYQNRNSDQWQLFVQTKKILSDSVSTFHVMFLTSKLQYGNFGGINDSILSKSSLSRYDVTQAPLMYELSETKNVSSLLQLRLETKHILFSENVSNTLFFNQSGIFSSAFLPKSDFQSYSYTNSYRSNTVQFSDVLSWNSDKSSLRGEIGIQKNTVSSDGIVNLSLQSTDPYYSISSGFQHNNLLLGLNTKSVFYEKRATALLLNPFIVWTHSGSWQTEISTSYFSSPLNYSDILRSGNSLSDKKSESGIVNEIRVRHSIKNSITYFGYFHSTLDSDASHQNNGRVLKDDQEMFSQSAVSTFRGLTFQNTSRFEKILLGGDLDLDARYQLAFDTSTLPQNDILLSIAHHDLWFENSLNLWLGIEGSYRSATSFVLFPDSRFGGFIYNVNQPAKSIKRVDLFARGQVSDMMIKFIYENAANEGIEYFDGYVMPTARFYFSISWWLWN